MAIVTGNPIGLLLTLTYTVTVTGSVKILPNVAKASAGAGGVMIKPAGGVKP